jgi:iron complex outermembrane receptor protein
VDAHALVDGMMSYDIPRLPGATVSLSGTNLLGRPTRYFLGAPAIGRLVLLRVGYEFQGSH